MLKNYNENTLKAFWVQTERKKLFDYLSSKLLGARK